MKAIFFFDSMLTPKIIIMVYWLLLLLACIAGFHEMSGGYGGLTPAKLLAGVGIIIGGGVGARIWCELLIVLFKIHENLRKIAEKEEKKAVPSQGQGS